MEHYEIERKYLICYPDIQALESMGNVTSSKICQTYLFLDDDSKVRVRKRIYKDRVEITQTEKIHVTDMKRIEREKEITDNEYQNLFNKAKSFSSTVNKTRFVIDDGDHKFEVDVYPFWKDRAIMEVELNSEKELFDIPEFITVLKEVTGDKRYNNSSIAKEIPYDAI